MVVEERIKECNPDECFNLLSSQEWGGGGVGDEGSHFVKSSRVVPECYLDS